MVIGTGGMLYGTTFVGGSSYGLIINDKGGFGLGAVFSLTPPTSAGGAWTETVLYSFTGSDGASPNAGVVIGKDGALYGTTLSTRVDSSLLLPSAGRCLMKNVTPPSERDGWQIEEATEHGNETGTD
jgi:hypothetical protein